MAKRNTARAIADAKADNVKAHPTIRCGFCCKTTAEVEYMVAGPTTFICSLCVDICNDIIRDARREDAAKSTDADSPK